jgi:hypothetical protein
MLYPACDHHGQLRRFDSSSAHQTTPLTPETTDTGDIMGNADSCPMFLPLQAAAASDDSDLFKSALKSHRFQLDYRGKVRCCRS